jgi:hypothetical protein
MNVQMLDVSTAAMEAQHPRPIELLAVEPAQQHVWRQSEGRAVGDDQIKFGVFEWK